MIETGFRDGSRIIQQVGKTAHAHHEEPGRIGETYEGDKPFVELVVTEQADVRVEDARVDVQSVVTSQWYPP